MNGSLSYLTFTKMKNRLKKLVRTPSQLIYALFIIAFLIFVAVTGNIESTLSTEFRDINELYAIIFGFFTIMYVLMLAQGYSQGASMFTMADVNLVFPGPIKPQSVLFYGLFRQLGTSIFIGVFLLFQYSWLHQLYGVGYEALFAIVFGYGLTIFLAQFTAMVLFCRTSHDEGAKRIVKMIIYGMTIALVIMAFLSILEPLQTKNYDTILPKLVIFATQFPVMLFPGSGWIAGLISALLSGDIVQAGLFTAILAVFIALLILLIIKSKQNYYEDVLQATETAQSAITAKKEGVVGEGVSKNVKTGKIGIDKGEGASAIYYKHLVENRRAGILGISNVSLVFVVISIAMAFFMKEAGIIAIFSFATYMQVFTSSLGRFPRELTKPYIYLMPEPPVKKMYYAVKESLRSNLIEAIVVFIPIGLIISADPVDVVICIAARVSFAMLFTAANVAVERVLGAVRTKALIMLFYILVLVVMALPGVVSAVLASIFLPVLLSQWLLPFLFLVASNILVSLLVFFLCRNMLQYAELNN